MEVWKPTALVCMDDDNGYALYTVSHCIHVCVCPQICKCKTVTFRYACVFVNPVL